MAVQTHSYVTVDLASDVAVKRSPDTGKLLVVFGGGASTSFMTDEAARSLADQLQAQLAQPDNIRRLPLGKARRQALNPGE